MREDGYFIAVDNFTGKTLDEGATKRCVHCGGHFTVRPGSGTTRGWCMSCSGVLCGARLCMTTCLPFERRLELEERGA